MADRPIRPCIGCGQRDDHPRHEVVLADFTSVFFHPDCHSMASPACPSCSELVAASGGRTGADLLAHLTATSTSKES